MSRQPSSFVDQRGCRRPVVGLELGYFRQSQQPIVTSTPYQPPFEGVTMSQIEKFPLTEIAGISPTDAFQGWATKVEDVTAFDSAWYEETYSAPVRVYDEVEEDTEDEDMEDYETQDEYDETQGLGPYQDWGNIEMVVRLQVDRKKLRAKLAGLEAQKTKTSTPNKASHNNGTPIDNDDDYDSEATISEPPSTTKNAAAFTNIRTVKNNRLPLSMTYRTTNDRPTLITNTNHLSYIQVPVSNRHPNTNQPPNLNKVTAGRITKPAPTPVRHTNTTMKPIATYHGTSPIPADILTAANAIHSVKKNKDNLPTKTLLWEMEGFVSSKGYLKMGNPLRKWAGDDRLFTGVEWGWILGER